MSNIRTIRDLGAVIRAAREAQRLTQATLATNADVSRRWLIAIEQGKHPRAELDRVLRVLKALDLDIRVGPLKRARRPAPAGIVFDLDAHVATFRSGA